jgi:ubiquinone/menaquinone biosynthesis C-methylase UbiE
MGHSPSALDNDSTCLRPPPANMPPNALSLDDCIAWRTWLWERPVAFVLGDRERLRGKRILDLGCGQGRMTCFFASAGAQADGVDMASEKLAAARAEARRLGLADRANFRTCQPDLSDLPAGEYDFVFTKSVLVMMGELATSLARIARLLKPSGEYLAVENCAAGPLLALYRRFLRRKGAHFYQGFAGIDRQSLAQFRAHFAHVEHRTFCSLVAAIRAARPLLSAHGASPPQV